MSVSTCFSSVLKCRRCVKFCSAFRLFQRISVNNVAQGNGAVRFYRLGRTSHLFNSGILQLYYVDLWGNICFITEKWGTTEADVACRQMGWSGASSTSPSINAGGR